MDNHWHVPGVRLFLTVPLPFLRFLLCHQSEFYRCKRNVVLYGIVWEQIELLKYHTDFLTHLVDIHGLICNIRSFKQDRS